MITNPDSRLGDVFGTEVAVRGDLAVVADATADRGVGAAYVFRRSGRTWVFDAKLSSASTCDGNADCQLAHVGLSGDLIGGGDPGATVSDLFQGCVHLFRYDPEARDWRLEATVVAADGDYNDRFGASVAVHGDVLLVGARKDEGSSGVPSSGTAYVFRRERERWIQEAKLEPPTPVESGLFGHSVSLIEDLAVIGAPGTFESGIAYVYRKNDDQWTLEATLSGEFGGQDGFGTSVSLHPDVVIVGAPMEDATTGAAYVFRRTQTVWAVEARLLSTRETSPFPAFGGSVAIDESGAIALIGAYWNWPGSADLYRFDGGNWQSIARLEGSSGVGEDQFGVVSVSGDTAWIGAPGQSDSEGSAYVFVGLAGKDCNYNGVPDTCDIFDGTSLDANENDVPDECEAVGDLNGDGTVDTGDLLLMLGHWGQCETACPPACTGDVDWDCTVGVQDLLILLAGWG